MAKKRITDQEAFERIIHKVQPTPAQEQPGYEQRLKRLALDFEMIPVLLATGHAFQVMRGLDEGVQVAFCSMDPSQRRLHVYLWSESFEVVPQGGQVPELIPELVKLALTEPEIELPANRPPAA